MRRVVCLVVILMLLLCTGCNGFQPVTFPSFGGQSAHGGEDAEDVVYAVEDTEYVYELNAIPIAHEYKAVGLVYETIPIQGKATVYDDRIFIYTLDKNDDSGHLLEYTAEGIEVETIVDPILYGRLKEFITKEC